MVIGYVLQYSKLWIKNTRARGMLPCDTFQRLLWARDCNSRCSVQKTSCLCASHEYHVQEFECRDQVLIHRPRLLSNWIYLAIACVLQRGPNDRSKFWSQATMFQCGREREVGPCNAWPPTNSFSTEYSYAGNRCHRKTSEGLSSTEWPCIKQDTSFVT